MTTKQEITAKSWTTEDVTRWLNDEARRIANAAFKAYGENLYRRCYLYCKPGAIRMFTEHETPEPGYILVTPEMIPRHCTTDEVQRWAYYRLQTAPCLPADV